MTDADGNDQTLPPTWLNGQTYVDEASVTPVYSSGTLSSIAQASGFNYNEIVYLSQLTTATNPYVCEFCP